MKSLLLLFLFILSCTLISFNVGDDSGSTEKLTPAQLAGKKIYTEGIGSSDVKITANMSGVKVPATVMKCINCHKADGTGNAEGGITPSNVTWSYLTRPYGGVRLSGEKYPSYTEQSLRKVITQGIDPAGNKVHNAMPTYNMTRTDLDNLIAYLKVLGEKSDVGLTKSTIHIGIALNGSQNESNSKNEAVKKVVQAYCKKVNENGGIYNRTLETSFFDANEKIDEDEYFMITGFGDQKNIASTTTPTLFPYSEQLTKNGLNNPNTFYIYPSIIAQNHALVDFSKKHETLSHCDEITIIYTNDEQRQTIANSISSYYSTNHGILPKQFIINSTNVKEIALNKNISSKGLIFFIGATQLGNELLKSLDLVDKSPSLLASGSVSGVDLFNMPEAFYGKVFIAYPTWITQRSRAGISTYQSLKKDNELLSNWKGSQLDAMSMIMTLEECLKEIGSDLTQDKLIRSLEGLYQFSNGLTPPLTYNVNQRVGSSNVYIATIDATVKQLKLVSTVHSTEK